MKIDGHVNKTEKYAIIDENNKIIAKFRLKATAINKLYEFHRDKVYDINLRLVDLEKDNICA